MQVAHKVETHMTRRRLGALREWFASLASNPAFAYLSILALQLKVIWGIWERMDLPTGDTASYFVLAQAWHLKGADYFVWSPLYTTFLGSFLSLSPDAYFATIAHRIVIVIALALLVLALMRSLLSPVVAWWTTAWWVMLPINFNSLYDVHLFFVVLILISYLVTLHLPGMYARGVGAAMLLAVGVLMRNETLASFALFAAIALGFDLAAHFRGGTVSVRRILLVYGVPLLLALLLCGFFYKRSLVRWPELKDALSSKHTLNVCQIYAFNYQQRHPDWTQSPWTACQPLIQSTFGKPRVTLWEATFSNPRAMTGYYWWNIQLIPSGLQVLLFNVASGRANPDYAPVSFNPPAAILGSILFLAVVTLGGVIFCRTPRQLYAAFVQPKLWGWIAMTCVAAVVILVMITERPRPSYMFGLGLLLMAAVGLSVQLVAGRWTPLTELRWLFPIGAAALIILAPCYFYRNSSFAARPTLEAYRHLRPFQAIIDPHAALVAPNAAAELCYYLSRRSNQYCSGIDYWGFRNSMSSASDWNQALARRNVQFFLANESVLTDPPGASFVDSAEANGWQVIGREILQGNRWVLLERR